MKILQITKYHYLRGGAERVFFNTMALLQKHGHEVVPFCVQHPDNLPTPWDKYFAKADELRNMGTMDRIRNIGRFFINHDAASKLDELLDVWKPDVAHLHNIFNGLSLAILPVLKKHGIPVVITCHDVRFMCPSDAFDFSSAVCRNCHRTGFISCVMRNCQKSPVTSVMGMLEMIHKDHFFHYDKFIDKYILLNSIYQGVFAKRHKYFGTKGEVLYNFIEMNNELTPRRGDYVLFAGRMTKEKGVELLLGAAAKLPGIKFIFAGSGPLEDMVRNSGLRNVECTGWIEGQELRNLIDNCAWAVIPSCCIDNNPMSLIEANAHYKPTIAAKIGGIPEIVQHGKTGFLFVAGDEQSLVATLKKAKSLSDEQYYAMANAAYHYAQENFSAPHHYKRLMEIYNAAIASHTGGQCTSSPSGQAM